jgi:arsenite methyltransferase
VEVLHQTCREQNVEDSRAVSGYYLSCGDRDFSTSALSNLTGPRMETNDCEMPGRTLTHPAAHQPESLFESCSWFYALCREYLFRDHTPEISRALFPPDGPGPGTKVLELGCGPGFYACRLSQEYPQIHTTGVDLSRRLLARAKSRAASRSLQNCTFAHGDAHSLPDASNSIDAIVVSRLFLIVADREAVLSEIFRVLRPGGKCFIAEPTSGFRTRIPLSCMWLLSKLTNSPAGRYREPRQADVMTAADFSALIRSQPWSAVDLQYDGWYQYAVCGKKLVAIDSESQEQAAGWSAA